MAWKPKTFVGKLLKGAAKAIIPIGGAVLGLGALKGMTKGVGVLQGVGLGITKAKKVIGTVGAGAVNLLTGTTKEERTQVQAVKAKTKAAADKLEQVDRLVRAGATVSEARATVGLSETELTSYDGAEVQSASMFDFLKNKTTLYIAGGLLALFLLPKLLKGKK